MKPTPTQEIWICGCGATNFNQLMCHCSNPEKVKYIIKSSHDDLLEAAKIAKEHLAVCIEKEHWVAVGKEEVNPLHQFAIEKLEKAIQKAEAK